MYRFIVFGAMAVWLGVAVVTQAFGADNKLKLDPAGVQVLPVAPETLDMFRACSRAKPTPPALQDLWVPSFTKIRTLEQNLRRYLPTLADWHLSADFWTVRFARQYVGFRVDGRDFIYGNFYPAKTKTADPAHLPVLVCDGGAHFWGIVYDVTAGQFAAPAFNNDEPRPHDPPLDTRN